MPGKIEMAPFTLWTRLEQGGQSRGVLAPGNHRLRGTLELDQASRKIGATISGKFEVNTTAFEEKKP